MVSIIGILLAVALLIYTCYKGIPAVIVAPMVSILVLVTSGLDIASGMSGAYMEGMAGFIQKYFLTMFTGAIFGAMMGDSGAAKSIGLKFGRIARKFPGKEKLMALWSLAALSFILGYGGVSVFVAFFTVIAVAKEMFEELDVPWRLYGVNILGAGVLALTMAPGSPSVNNVIAGEALGTNAMAAPALGIIGCLIAVFLAGIYFKWEIRQVEKNHEGFLPTGAEIAKVQLKVADDDFQEMNILTCLIPSIVLIVTLNVFKQPVYIAATFGILVGYVVYWKRMSAKIETFKRGAMQSINSVCTASMVIAFGSVVGVTSGFALICSALGRIPGPGEFQVVLAVNIAAGVAGSSAGGLTIALNALADRFIGPLSEGGLAMNPQVVHRIATICSGGLDSLPSNGTIINELTQARLPHRVGYRPMGVCSVIIPLIVAICLSIIAQFGIV